MTETTNLFPDSAEPLPKNDGVMFDMTGSAHSESAAAGSSAEQTGAVRSWPGSTPSDDSPAVGGDGRQLSAMRLPDLQRLAQSLGLAGTARMRKGQLIAAIEEAGQGRTQGAGRPSAGESAGLLLRRDRQSKRIKWKLSQADRACGSRREPPL